MPAPLLADTRPDGGPAVLADAAGSVTAGSVTSESDADGAVTAMYGTQYRSLVRLAALLVGDVGAAEEVVQDSFVAMHGAWARLRDQDKALSYLRRSVISRSRSIQPPPAGGPAGPSPGWRQPVISALRALPPRQREALALRLYLDLPQEQVAAAMGISPRAVQNHTARGMAALRGVL